MTELELNIANTAAFIAADPSVITVLRDSYISDGAGGQKKSGSPTTVRVSEIVRMIPQGSDNATANPVTQTTNGALSHPDFVMLGLPALGLQRNDYFDWLGRTWEIASIRDTPAYETKADVAIREDI